MKQDSQPTPEPRQSSALPPFQARFLAPRYWGVWLAMGVLRLCSLLPSPMVGIAWWGSPARLKRLVRFRGREHYDQALAQGRRVMLLAPHFVGLEMAGA